MPVSEARERALNDLRHAMDAQDDSEAGCEVEDDDRNLDALLERAAYLMRCYQRGRHG